ncbi:FMN-binding negative transcriptional regulator [Arsukibacterium indicum]|uniref:FMN-binding negative transcriptional regulator n=1 Tax=Arsukibacterium indicum TaxID=2848612 RepID=A0ABS6MNH0_9GAMM|nr:FMN-binding negative transcriptional regulator [Arsukibacterium indicum]MBV2130341.1 FMN-binding negative transcriptional regulator [Arsukibacterium indicum]
MLYCPPQMVFADKNALHDFIEQHSFGTLISTPFFCSHLPWLLQRDEGEHGVLYGHIARQNPHWRQLEKQQVLITFTGPQAYISPRWYYSELAVPTWNYAVAQVQGQAELLAEAATIANLAQQVAKYEPDVAAAMVKMPNVYQQKLAAGIVGVKVNITEFSGKLKLGQHRSVADQQGVFAALSANPEPEAQALAALMQQLQLGAG